MFALVKFDNDEFYITQSTKIKRIQGDACHVKYKRGAIYGAKIISTNDSERLLNKQLKQLRNETFDQKSIEIDLEKKIPCQKRKKTRSEYEANETSLVEGVGCSTPVNTIPPNIRQRIRISDILVNENTNSVSRSDVDETSAAPSGMTDLMEFVGDDWLKNSIDDNTSQDVDSLPTDMSIHHSDIDQSYMDGNTDEVHSLMHQDEPRTSQMDTHTYECVDNEKLKDNIDDERDKNRNNVDNKQKADEVPCKENIKFRRPMRRYHPHDRHVSFESPNCTHEDEDDTNKTENENQDDQDDESNNDPNYTPDCDITAGTSQHSYNKAMGSSYNSTNASYRSTDISSCGPPSVDVRHLIVPQSNKNKKKTSKKDFCIYCKKLVTQFARHLQSKTHQKENDVKEFMKYPMLSLKRKRLINNIRKKGNFLHNTSRDYNTGILITCRQQQVKSNNTAEDYIVCTNCQGSFSKRTIRIHYKKCNTAHKKGVREITCNGRQMSAYVHARANATLQKIIIPGMHDDDVTRSIKYDELIIIAGNKFCEKYTLDQHVELIRSNLRLLGRLKIAVIKKNELITEFADIFHPQYYDTVVEGVKEVASYDPKKRLYRAPSNATTLGTLLKKCSRMLIAECIKSQNDEKKKAIEDFMVLYEDDYPTTINKKVMEDQIKKKREKREILPMKEDINKLYTHLKKICSEAMKILNENFDYLSWRYLAEASLILLQMFNRRRSGEIERLLITDYNKRESVDENVNPELFSKLSKRSREFAKRYVRVTIRGKLNRTVPVLFDASLVKWVDTIIRLRSNAGVKSNNKYVFGVPTASKMAKKYLRACPLIRKFSEECGAVMPESLRGTKLRKHIATYTAMLGIQENQVDDLANFMGHNKQIHKDIYRVPVPFRDITDVSQLLLAAMGANEEDDENVSEDNNDYDEPINDNFDSIPRERNTLSQMTNENVSNDSGGSSEDDEVPSKPSKRRSTSPFGKTKREKWTEEEKRAVIESFGDVKQLKTLPTLKQCTEAIEKYTVLRRRNPQTIKSWIDNQRKATGRKLLRSKRS